MKDESRQFKYRREFRRREFFITSRLTNHHAMKNYLFSLAILSILICSCGKSAKNESQPLPGTTIVREKYSTGGIKSEITMVNDIRQGITKNFDRQGRLLSEVNYVDNLKEGIATNYYAATGKIHSTITFKYDIKEGDETWYYESGKPYRISPYVQGKIEGVQKLLYENGQVKAEIPYKNGLLGLGTQEYNKDGSPIKDYPEIVIKKEDHLKTANKVLLVISLSKEAKDVRFYTGDLSESKYLHEDLLARATQEGSTQVDFTVPPGSRINEDIVITASYKTRMGNPRVVTKTYNLQASNAQ